MYGIFGVGVGVGIRAALSGFFFLFSIVLFYLLVRKSLACFVHVYLAVSVHCNSICTEYTVTVIVDHDIMTPYLVRIHNQFSSTYSSDQSIILFLGRSIGARDGTRDIIRSSYLYEYGVHMHIRSKQS